MILQVHKIMGNLNLIKQFLTSSIKVETAYVQNNLLGIFSIVFFMISNVFLINIVFQNVNEIAGYSKDQILFFNLISQLWFFSLVGLNFKNVEMLIQGVRNGNFDYILTKPRSSLLLTFLSNISIVYTIRDSIPSILILVISINWSNLSIEPINLIVGLLISTIGIIISIIVNFIVALPVFWTANSENYIDLYLIIEDNSGHNNFVLEIWNNFFRLLFTFILPTAISSAVSTSVIFGRSNPIEMFFSATFVLILFGFLLVKLWGLALKNYSSASS